MSNYQTHMVSKCFIALNNVLQRLYCSIDQVSELWNMYFFNLGIMFMKTYITTFLNICTATTATAVAFFSNSLKNHCCFLEQYISDFPHLLSLNLVEIVILLIILFFSPASLPSDLVWDHSWPTNISWLTTVYFVFSILHFLCVDVYEMFFTQIYHCAYHKYKHVSNNGDYTAESCLACLCRWTKWFQCNQ